MKKMIALFLLAPLAAHAAPSPAAGDEAACQAAIQAVERTAGLPPALMSAIARTESGRVVGGRLVAWPWTINVAGTGYYYGSAQEAVAAVEGFRASGVQSIDVGCMQVNLVHHPGAFASLQQAFDPAVNVRYAAQFLTRLQAELGTWPGAIGAYHSRTPDLADGYGRRVMQAWPMAGAYGGFVGARAAAAAPRQPAVDPYGVYTPEFARRVAVDAVARNAREGLRPPASAPRPAGTLAPTLPVAVARAGSPGGHDPVGTGGPGIPGSAPAVTPAFGPATVINGAQSQYLDVVRGLAAQLVLLHHAAGYALPASGLGDIGGGALGVLAFFLLLGFLIADNVQSRLSVGRFSLTEFIVSRFTRIYLPYVPAIVLVALLDRITVLSPVYEYADDFTWPTAVANLFMLQDYPLFQILRRLQVPDQPWFFKTFGSGRQFWTVSIEWWIYLTVGLATYLALRRRSPPLGLWLLLGFVAVEPIYNLVGGPGDSLTLTWLMGAAANVAYRWMAADLAAAHRPSWWRAAWCAVAVLAGTPAVLHARSHLRPCGSRSCSPGCCSCRCRCCWASAAFTLGAGSASTGCPSIAIRSTSLTCPSCCS